jgi:hypothetical protein
LRDLTIGAVVPFTCRQCHDGRREVGRTAQPGRIRSLGGARPATTTSIRSFCAWIRLASRRI